MITMYSFAKWIAIMAIHFHTIPTDGTSKVTRGDVKFDTAVEKLFQMIKIPILSKTCKYDKNFWCNTLLPTSIHICHRFPDSAIRHILNTHFHDQAIMYALINMLFKMDEHAYGLDYWKTNKNKIQQYLVGEFVPQNPKLLYFPQAKVVPLQDSIPVGDDISIDIPKSMSQLNDDIIQKAFAHCIFARSKVECYAALYTAPANLRLGFGPVNQKISDNLDLMGDIKGYITPDEVHMVQFYEFYYIEEMNVSERKKGKKNRELCQMTGSGYCYKEGDEFFFLSSSAEFNNGYVKWNPKKRNV